eukprot:91675_1
MAEDEGCPIESNIKSTDDGNNKNDDGMNDWNVDYMDEDNDDNDFADENDAEFDEEDGDALMDDDNDWGSVHSSEQDQIVINIEKSKPVIQANEINPYGEGNEVAIANGAKPQIVVGDPKQKCWICDICNAVNNLLESMKKY